MTALEITLSVTAYILICAVVIAALWMSGKDDVDDTDVVDIGYEAGRKPEE